MHASISKRHTLDWLGDMGRKAPRPRQLSRFFASRYRFCPTAICNIVAFFFAIAAVPRAPNLSHRPTTDPLTRFYRRATCPISVVEPSHRFRDRACPFVSTDGKTPGNRVEQFHVEILTVNGSCRMRGQTRQRDMRRNERKRAFVRDRTSAPSGRNGIPTCRAGG